VRLLYTFPLNRRFKRKCLNNKAYNKPREYNSEWDDMFNAFDNIQLQLIIYF